MVHRKASGRWRSGSAPTAGEIEEGDSPILSQWDGPPVGFPRSGAATIGEKGKLARQGPLLNFAIVSPIRGRVSRGEISKGLDVQASRRALTILRRAARKAGKKPPKRPMAREKTIPETRRGGVSGS